MSVGGWSQKVLLVGRRGLVSLLKRDVTQTPVNRCFGTFGRLSGHISIILSRCAARVCALGGWLRRRERCTTATESVEHVSHFNELTSDEQGVMNDKASVSLSFSTRQSSCDIRHLKQRLGRSLALPRDTASKPSPRFELAQRACCARGGGWLGRSLALPKNALGGNAKNQALTTSRRRRGSKSPNR